MYLPNRRSLPHLSLLPTLALLLLQPALGVAEDLPVVFSVRAESAWSGSHDTHIRIDSALDSSSARDTTVEELHPSLGASLGVEIPISPYFAPGVLVRGMAWSTKAAQDLELVRNLWLDVDLTLRARLPLLEDRIAFYLLIPVGVTINRFSEDVQGRFDADWYHGVGVNFSLLAGFAGQVTPALTLFIESGWTYRYFEHSSHGDVFGAPAGIALENAVNQLSLNLGVSFNLNP